MKRILIAMCSSALLLPGGAVFAQASDSMAIKDSSMPSDAMASGAMGKKQHIRKHTGKQGMNADQAASGGKGK